MTYKFVGNEEDVNTFFDMHIKNSFGGFLILPLARRKYYLSLSDSQINISTKIVYKESDLLNELQRYEVAIGLYKDKNGAIPNEAFGMYLSANPMDELEGFFSFQKDMLERIRQHINGNETNLNRIMSIFKSHLHKTVLQRYLKLDIDTKEPKNIEILTDFFKQNGINPYLIIETRGGYHILLDNVCGSHHSILYKFAKEHPLFITIEKNGMIVIPGTYQGGFLTRIVTISQLLIKIENKN